MSFYSSIDRRINADEWFCALPHMAQLVWFRLLTGPHVTPVAGLWPASEPQLAHKFGMSIGAFRTAFSKLAGADDKPTGKVYADWKAGVLWLPKSIHVPSNQPKNENVLRGWAKHIELVPECSLRDAAVTEIINWVTGMSGAGNRFPNGLPNTFPKPRKQLSEPFAKQLAEPLPEQSPRANQEQENEQEQEQSAARNTKPGTFAMHSEWVPTEITRKGLDVALIPRFAQDALIHAHRSHFLAETADFRTDAEWNQSCSRWVHRDWSNPKKRPIKPPEMPPANDETGGYGPRSEWQV
jgi:hypothetical protein